MSGLLGGGGGGTCDEPLVPLGNTEPNAETFAQVDQSMTRVVDALQAGDMNGAVAFFNGDTHNFTHNVDPVLREQDEDAAKELCETVIALETSLIEQPSLAAARTDAQRLHDELRDAAEILGYTQAGG